MRRLPRPFGSIPFLWSAVALATVSSIASPGLGAQSAPAKKLELSRPARPWEFLAAVGKRAGLLGNESGKVEAWVYPLKILRDLQLTILTEGREIPTETLVRTVIARPESTTLVYTGDTFSIRETFFAPLDQPGAVIEIQVETEQPLELKACFVRDFQLEWPAAMGGTYVSWNEELHGFVFGEDHQKFAALAGSPSAAGAEVEYDTNYGGTHTSSMKLGVTAKGRDTKIIVIAGSINGRAEAEKTYRLLTDEYQKLWHESAEFYQKYLQRTVSVELPDAEIQRAYDWSRVSLIQGLVTNPTMGDGLIAGYRTSGEGYRPGFAWFFGRDSLWCDLALNSEGDFATTKTALEFIAKFQREDGKIPHEIAQGASFVDWFKGYPYAYASADATPLYIVAADDYVATSGDVGFAKANWEHIAKAYEFLRSTYDSNGFPRNFGVGHGWVEGGPLLPIESEFYQSGLAVAAIRALAHLSELTGKDTDAKSLNEEFSKEQRQLNEAFWSPEKKIFAFAIDRDNRRVDEATVLTAVPMWFGLTDEQKSQQTIAELSKPEHETDWGMRIISNRAPKYSGGGYHYGSVWPLFTGWASVAEYRHHRPQAAYDNLRANALLALDGSTGHVTEVLSGDYYQPLSTNSPHQIWSAAMVISPMLRGMFGLQFDAQSHTLTFAPHIPAGWKEFAIRHVAAGTDVVDLQFSRTPDSMTVLAERNGDAEVRMDFRPAVSPRAEIIGVTLNGRNVPFHLQNHDNDQHVSVNVSLAAGANTLKIGLRDDFAVTYAGHLPALGSTSQGLHVVSETWNASRDTLTLALEGIAGKTYALSVWGQGQIKALEGAEIEGQDSLEVSFAPDASTEKTQKQRVAIHFTSQPKKSKLASNSKN
jgi:GH15 family glucan-1,4-alpha-glucosidase